jgi:mannose/fructose/N-acetylgalactosamine-specific phosphotransferase system component IIC
MSLWAPLALMSGPDLPTLVVLGLFTGILALDDTAFAQTWFGQPLPAAVLAGYICGDPLTGLAVGLPLQLVLAGNLPVGQTFTGDPTSATVAAVTGTLLGGQKLYPVLAEDPAGTWQHLGWVILGAGLLSLLGHLVIQTERRGNGLLMLQGHRTLRDGRLGRIERLHLRCLVSTFGRGFSLGILFIIFIVWVWNPLFPKLPPFVQEALGTLPLLLPGLGVGTMVDRYGLRTSWPWVTAGLVCTFLVVKYAI